MRCEVCGIEHLWWAIYNGPSLGLFPVKRGRHEPLIRQRHWLLHTAHDRETKPVALVQFAGAFGAIRHNSGQATSYTDGVRRDSLVCIVHEEKWLFRVCDYDEIQSSSHIWPIIRISDRRDTDDR